MAGQIVKRADSTWVVRVYLGRDAGGKRKYLNRTVHGNKKDAQAVLNRLLIAKDTGQVVEDPRLTLDEYLDHWLEAAVKPRVRAATHKEYAATLRRYIRPTLGAMRVLRVRPVDIQSLYSEMQASGRGGMVRYAHTVLRNALAQAVKWQMLGRNPADFVDLPKQRRKEMHALSRDEVDCFLEATRGYKQHVLFSLLLASGLRPSEALALRWQDLDLGKGTLTVKRSVRYVSGKWTFNEPKTASGRRTIPLPASLVSLLSDHMGGQPVAAAGLVFCNLDGNPLHERGIVHSSFKPALKRAGLPEHIRLYDLRHTHATLLLTAGVHPKIVSERLGHANISITLDTYSHVLPHMQQEAADKLEAMLFKHEAKDTSKRAYN